MTPLRLPRPISVNNLFAGGAGGRRTSKAYATWKREADLMLMSQRPLPRFSGPVAVAIYAGCEGIAATADIDNCAKAMLDALVRMQVIPDDSMRHVRRVTLEWVPGMHGSEVIVSDWNSGREPGGSAGGGGLAASHGANGKDGGHGPLYRLNRANAVRKASADRDLRPGRRRQDDAGERVPGSDLHSDGGRRRGP